MNVDAHCAVFTRPLLVCPSRKRNARERRAPFDHGRTAQRRMARIIDYSRAGAVISSMVWTWTVRLSLPVLLGILGAALHVMWWESPYKHGVLDFIGTASIVVAMLGIVVWCVCAWLGSEGGTTPLPPASH